MMKTESRGNVSIRKGSAAGTADAGEEAAETEEGAGDGAAGNDEGYGHEDEEYAAYLAECEGVTENGDAHNEGYHRLERSEYGRGGRADFLYRGRGAHKRHRSREHRKGYDAPP